MNTLKIKTIPVVPYHQNRRADLMIDAGEFAIALSRVLDRWMIEEMDRDEDAEPAMFDDRTVGGLLAGLRVVGDTLVNEGSNMAADALQAETEARS